MCAHVLVQMSMHAHVHTHVHAHVQADVHADVYTHVRAHAHAHVYAHVHAYVVVHMSRSHVAILRIFLMTVFGGQAQGASSMWPEGTVPE